MDTNEEKKDMEDWSGVNNHGSSVNQYGVNSHGLGLKIPEDTDGASKSTDKSPKIGLKLNSDTRPEKYDADFDVEEGITENLIRTQSVSQYIDLTDYKPVGPKPQGPLLTIFMILVYVFMCGEIALLAWLVSNQGIDFYYDLMSAAVFISAVQGVLLLDAILVNILYKRKISLVFVAWLIPFLYPLKRSSHIGNNNTMGHLICWCYVVGVLSVCFAMFNVGNEYGNAMMLEDEKTRHEVAALFDQTKNERRIGTALQRNVALENYYLEQKNGVDYVVMSGIGTVYIDRQMLVDDKNVEVSTAFYYAKQNGGAYKLVAVQLGETVLRDVWLEQYWTSIME